MYEECVLQIRERPDRSNQRLLACEEQLGNWLGHERIHQGDEYNTDLYLYLYLYEGIHQGDK